MPVQEKDVLGKLTNFIRITTKCMLKIYFKHLIIHKSALTYMFLMNCRIRTGQKNHRDAGGMFNFAYASNGKSLFLSVY